MATHSSIPAWENPKDRGAWRATVCGVTKNRTKLSDLLVTHNMYLSVASLGPSSALQTALLSERSANKNSHRSLRDPARKTKKITGYTTDMTYSTSQPEGVTE